MIELEGIKSVINGHVHDALCETEEKIGKLERRLTTQEKKQEKLQESQLFKALQIHW